ncbi:MAG: hypothetical protein K2G35_02920 [Duncaniella sp.]|nr:hypothetical protein [Duncaniella sp.]
MKPFFVMQESYHRKVFAGLRGGRVEMPRHFGRILFVGQLFEVFNECFTASVEQRGVQV